LGNYHQWLTNCLTFTMELRNHPRMICLGRRSWPPDWRGPYGPDNPLPSGEVGVLVGVEPPPGNLRTPHCILVIECNGQEYIGSLRIDDENFLEDVLRLLRSSLGRPLSEIGSLDLP
jgi:hypothetical protein